MSADAFPPTDDPSGTARPLGADEVPADGLACHEPGVPPVGFGNVPPPIEAQLGPPPGPHKLPQPNLLVAILLAILPVIVQASASIAVFIAGAVVLRAAHGHLGSPAEIADAVNDVLLPLATFTNLLVALTVVGIAFGRHAARRIAWRNCSVPQWLATLLLVLPLAILASEVSNCASDALSLFEPAWLEEFRETNSQIFADFARQSWLLVFVGACLLPGLGEEIYCRGLISRGLVARYGVWAGTVFASLIFGAMHLEPIQASSAFVLGLALQYLFLVTRSLPAPIALHVLNNFGAFLVMRYENHFHIPGLSLTPNGAIVHTPPWLVGAALLASTFLGGVLYQMRTRWLLPSGEPWSPGYVTAESPPVELQAQATSARPRGLLVVLTLAVYLAFLGCLVAANQPPR